jgi:glutathione S-transferase
MIRLYDFLESGNCYKVRLLLCQRGLPFERVPMDILAGATRTPEYLARNPNGRVPLVEWPDGRRLAESNAILWHLAEGTAYLPADAFARARALEWMFFEQYSHEPCIAVVRFWHFAGLVERNRDALPAKMQGGYAALGVLEQHLGREPWLAGGRYSIADIALYAYTHVAHEGGFELARFPAVRAWLERVRTQPGHVGIENAVGTPARPPWLARIAGSAGS